jgi:hypothetical protein
MNSQGDPRAETAEAALEMPWNFEREPKKLHETVVKVARDVFELSGLVERVLGSLKSRAAEQPPSDYERDDDDDVRRLVSIIERLSDRPPSNDYNERPGKEKETSWTERILSACVTLVVIGIPALILMYGKLQVIEANQNNQQKQIDELKQMVQRRP